MKDLISNCFLCEEHSLHVAGTEEVQVMQCISCGYTTSTKYTGTIKTNKEIKKWAVEKNGKIWIPSIITLPIGMLYPINIDNMVNHKKEMKWAFAPMVDIPEDERKDYPNEKGDFYERKIDTDNPKIYDKFIVGMSYINQLMKIDKKTESKFPKLKKSK